MIFDTDVLIWVQRGNQKAADLIERTEECCISVLTYMELLQCAHNKEQHLVIKDFLKMKAFTILPLTENIGHRAAVYIEEYSLSCGIRAGDSVIAATAIEENMILVSGNKKHFKLIQDLQLKPFSP